VRNSITAIVPSLTPGLIGGMSGLAVAQAIRRHLGPILLRPPVEIEYGELYSDWDDDGSSSDGPPTTQEIRLGHEMLDALLPNADLQTFLKEDEPFQDLICAAFYMNKTDRIYFQDDPLDKLKGMCVLNSTRETVDGLFLHLRENPSLCDRAKKERPKPSRKRKDC
jgi:hypothetical protein